MNVWLTNTLILQSDLWNEIKISQKDYLIDDCDFIGKILVHYNNLIHVMKTDEEWISANKQYSVDIFKESLGFDYNDQFVSNSLFSNFSRNNFQKILNSGLFDRIKLDLIVFHKLNLQHFYICSDSRLTNFESRFMKKDHIYGYELVHLDSNEFDSFYYSLE